MANSGYSYLKGLEHAGIRHTALRYGDLRRSRKNQPNDGQSLNARVEDDGDGWEITVGDFATEVKSDVLRI